MREMCDLCAKMESLRGLSIKVSKKTRIEIDDTCTSSGIIKIDDQRACLQMYGVSLFFSPRVARDRIKKGTRKQKGLPFDVCL
jgi:hypothetical protein